MSTYYTDLGRQTMKRSKKQSTETPRWAELDEAVQTMPEGQRKIIEAAMEEFAEKGYAASSTLAIAGRAGVSEGLIFKYFKNKVTLLRQVVFPILATAIMPLAIRGVKSITDSRHETFGDFLRALVRERLEFARRHQKHLRILLQELPLNEELRNRMMKMLQAELFPVMQQKILHYQKTGELRSMPPEQMLSLLIPQILGFVLGRAVFGLQFGVSDERDLDVLIEAILHGVHATAPAPRNARGQKR